MSVISMSGIQYVRELKSLCTWNEYFILTRVFSALEYSHGIGGAGYFIHEFRIFERRRCYPRNLSSRLNKRSERMAGAPNAFYLKKP